VRFGANSYSKRRPPIADIIRDAMPPKGGMKEWIRQQKLAAKAAQATAAAAEPGAAAAAAAARPSAPLLEAGQRVQHRRLRCCGRALHGEVGAGGGAGGEGTSGARVAVQWDAAALAHVQADAEVDADDVSAQCNLRGAVSRKYGDDSADGPSAAAVPAEIAVDAALLARLRTLELRASALASLEGLDAGALPNLQTLDVSCNLLTSLAGVAAFLVAAAPTLSSVNISDNTLLCDVQLPPAAAAAAAAPADSCAPPPGRRLDVLAMNNVGNCSWEMVLALVAAAGCTAVREVSLCDNGFTGVPAAVGGSLQSLETVRLDGNRIESWESISVLSRMRHIARLSLNRNPLCGSWCDDREGEETDGHGGEAGGHVEKGEGAPADGDGDQGGAQAAGGARRYSALRSLSLNGTRISAWAQVDALARLPSLRDVRLQELELTRTLSAEAQRMLLIAHLPNVSSGGKGRQTVGSETCGLLNGSMITANERRDAHRFFLEYWEQLPASERPVRYATLLRDDPIAKRLANAAQDGSGLAVVGGACRPHAAGGAGAAGDAAGEHAVLHDGVMSSSFGARGLGRCE